MNTRWIGTAVGVVTLVGLLSACGSTDAGEPADPGQVPDPTTADTATDSDQSGAESADAGSGDQARALLITAEDLPAGWRDSNPPSSAFRMTVCGVDTEPVEPVDIAQTRFAETAVGPFLYEYVRTYDDASTPAQVTEDLAAALPGCTEFSTRGTAPDSPEAHFDLEQIEVPNLPQGAVAWRMTPQTEAPMVQDVVFIPTGTSLVAFLSASLGEAPDPAVLEAAVDALPVGD